MKFLKRAPVNDDEIIDAISKNKRIKDHALILGASTTIKANYKKYRKNLATINSTPPLGYQGNLANALRRVYTNEVKGLEFISHIRDKMSIEGCPMCGKPTNGGEVDHIFEKETYSEYAFYSYNLVPGCKCNNNRVPCSIGGVVARPLHPYFDKAMRRRLARASIAGAFSRPKISVEPVGCLRYMKPKVATHLKSVVIPNGIEDWLAKKWEVLLLNPTRALALDTPAVTPGELVRQIKRLRDASDSGQSMNSWDSIWYSGLLARPAAIHGLRKLMAGVNINLIPDII